MRDIIATLRTLTLPFGATSGKRIVLDGVNGTITVYDADGDIRIRLGSSSQGILELGTGDPLQTIMSEIFAFPSSLSSDPLNRLGLSFSTPLLSGAPASDRS